MREIRSVRVAECAFAACVIGSVATYPVPARTEVCNPSDRGCIGLLAQYVPDGTTQAPVPPAEPARDSNTNRGLFLALFAQQILPALANVMTTWVQVKAASSASDGAAQAGSNAYGAGAGTMPMNTAAAPGAMPWPGDAGMNGAPGMNGQAGMNGAPGMNGMPPMGGESMNMATAMSQPPGVMPPMQGAMPPMPGAMQQMPAAAPMPGYAADTPIHAGVAYQVSLLQRDGSRMLVDPEQRAFTTGERIEIAYRPNFPGVVEVYNIDSMGRQEQIDRQQLAATQLATLGPYEFVNVKGQEILRIVLRPCLGNMANTPNAMANARLQFQPQLAGALRACDDPALSHQQVATRGIAKVAREGGTNYALDPVSRNEIESGRLAPREVQIRFMHQ